MKHGKNGKKVKNGNKGRVQRITAKTYLTTFVFLLLMSVSIWADPVTFTANTTGSFNSGTCVTCSVDNDTVPTITASGGGGLSAIGFISNTNTLNTPAFSVMLNNLGDSAVVTLGQFTAASSVPLGTGPNFSGSTFALNVSFTAPPGSGSGIFNATLNGQLTQSSSGVQVQFINPVLSFNSSAGAFSLVVDPISYIVGTTNNTPITARLTLGDAAAIPEPATLLLLGTGLAGIASAIKKRKASVSGHQS